MDDAQVEELRTNGVVLLPRLFSERVIDFRSAIEIALRRPTPLARDFARNEQGSFYSDMYLSAWFPEFRRLLSPRIGEVAARFLDSRKIFLFNDEILIKSPNTERETPWHHDMSYWPLSGSKVCSLWIALDSIDKRNGGMELLRGSHRWTTNFHPRDFDTGDDRITSSDEVSVQTAVIDPRDVVSFEVEPGDALVFHARTLHRAFGNRHPDSPRRALVYRLVGDDVTYSPRRGTIPLIWAPDLAPGELFRDTELFPQLHG
jgi:ectoine hydroxylase-related dioxygenase (phytanoyl-CoA dioxygenase family)